MPHDGVCMGQGTYWFMFEVSSAAAVLCHNDSVTAGTLAGMTTGSGAVMQSGAQ